MPVRPDKPRAASRRPSPRGAKVICDVCSASFDSEVHEVQQLMDTLTTLIASYRTHVIDTEKQKQHHASILVTRFMRKTRLELERERRVRQGSAFVIQRFIRIQAQNRIKREEAIARKNERVLELKRQKATKLVRNANRTCAAIMVQCAWRCAKARHIASKQLPFFERIKRYHEQRMASLVIQKWWSWRKWALTSSPNFQEKVRKRKAKLRMRKKRRFGIRPRNYTQNRNYKRKPVVTNAEPDQCPPKTSRASKNLRHQDHRVQRSLPTKQSHQKISEDCGEQNPKASKQNRAEENTARTPVHITHTSSDMKAHMVKDESPAVGRKTQVLDENEGSATTAIDADRWEFRHFPECKYMGINHDRAIFEHGRAQVVGLLKEYDDMVRRKLSARGKIDV